MGGPHPARFSRDVGSKRPPLCHPEEPICLWQVKGAMTLPPVPATKVGCPIQAPSLGLSGIRSTQRPSLRFVIRSEVESLPCAKSNGDLRFHLSQICAGRKL